MAACVHCKAPMAEGAKFCSACGQPVGMEAVSGEGVHARRAVSAIFAHVPHPHIQRRRNQPPRPARAPASGHALARINNYLAVRITDAVGTMWCAYAFAALALVSLPAAVQGGVAPFIQWLAQTFIQLVLLSIIIVGQKVAGEASDKRAIDTYNDAEALLHEAVQLQHHLAAQDAQLQHLVDELAAVKAGERTANGAANDRPA